MKTASVLSRVLAAAWLVAALPVAADNLSDLKDAPIARFSEQDMKLFKQTLNEALDSAPDGETRQWSNPETKAEGTVKPIRTFARGGLPCRTVSIHNAAKGRKATSQFSFCKQASAQWTQTP